jgi:hypothetical protein
MDTGIVNEVPNVGELEYWQPSVVPCLNRSLIWHRSAEGLWIEPDIQLNSLQAAFFLIIDGQKNVKQLCEHLSRKLNEPDDDLMPKIKLFLADSFQRGLVFISGH